MPTAIARQALAEKIIALFKPNAYVFGGYLRDQVAGDEFNDLDLFFPKYDPTYIPLSGFQVRSALRKAGLKPVRAGTTKSIYNHNTGMRLEKETLEVEDPETGINISVDIVSNAGSTGSYNDHPFTDIDADINSLWFNKATGKIEAHPSAGYLLPSVVDHISKKVFEMPPYSAITGERITKLFAKGYRPAIQLKDKNCSPIKEDKTPPPATGRKETKMETRGFMNQLKSDMEKATYRSCSHQVVKAAKQGILTAMKTNGVEDGTMSYMTKVLDSEVGTAGISALLGHGLPHAPVVGTDPRVVRLAEEFRVAGYSEGLNFIFAMLMQYIMPGIMAALQNLPPAPAAVSEQDMAELDAISQTKVRVSATENIPTVPDLTLASEQEQESEMPMASARSKRSARA